MKKTKRVLFKAYSSDSWMGAVYYVKNIVYQFLEYTKSDDRYKYEIYIYIPKEKAHIYDFCKMYDNVHFLYSKERPWSNGDDFFSRNIRELGWIIAIYGMRIGYIYPNFSPKSIYHKKSISWIPDFQHVYYPDFFTKEERAFRDAYFFDIAQNHGRLVLSSQDAYDTYCRLYPNYVKGVGVVHFVSAIDERDIAGDINHILTKYGVENDNYFMISNQFYRHKNHKSVIEAVRKLKEERRKDIQIICTGLTEDIKDPSFFGEIEELITRYNLNDNIKILGLIPREDQLTLMRYSIAVIQPSLFEGWGTCTEDAKTLGKITVLSDIPVHREQADDLSLFFNKDSVLELADILEKLWEEYYNKMKSYTFGVKNAEEYGHQFANMLEEKLTQ